MEREFYMPEKVVAHQLKDFAELEALVADGKPFKLFHPKFHLPEEAKDLLHHLTVEYRSIPVWVENWNFNNWLNRSKVWTLYSFEGRE